MRLRPLFRFSAFIVISLLIVLSFFAAPLSPAFAADNYRPMTPEQIDAEIDAFHEVGAQAYIIWQYSGYRTSAFENDQYSFFRDIAPGPAICAKLAEKSAQYPDMLIGVNMWYLVTLDPGTMADHLGWLKSDCGVKIVRFFAYPGMPENQVNTAGVSNAMQAIEAAGLKAVVAIGDYSNGGGGIPKGTNAAWYASGYKGPYLTNAQAIYSVVSRHKGALFALELANEPHCGGDTSEGAMNAYTAWITNMSGLLSGVPVSAGQVGSDNVPGRCDNPLPAGSDSEFARSNASSNVDAASSHYYNSDQKANALIAATEVPGKIYYIGEAGWGGDDNDSKNDYYLYPIRGLEDLTSSLEDKTRAIQNDLINQGYEVSCTTPAFDITAETGGQLQDFYDNGGSGTLPVKATQVFDLTGASYPLMRGDGSPTLRTSMETYWGARNPDETGPKRDISSAPLYRLLSPAGQCKAQVKMLEVIDEMCAKLVDPTKCALAQQIPGTNFAMGPTEGQFGVKSLLQAFREENISCENLVLTNLRNLSPEETARRQELKAGLDRTPLYLDKAYRLAFLVIATELKNPDKPVGGNIFFNFLRGLDRSSLPKHEVKVVAFKIPDFATNKYLDDPITYKDPLQLTRDALLRQKDIDNIARISAAQRADFAGKVANLASQNPDSYPVQCGDAFCTRLNDPLSGALVGMVNAGGQVCKPNIQDLQAEPVTQVMDSVSLGDNQDSGIFKPDFKMLDNLFSDPAQKEDPDKVQFDFLSDITIQDQLTGPEDHTTTYTYLVYPVGFDLSTVEDTLASVIFTDSQIMEFKTNKENLRYFEIQDAEIEVESDKPQLGFNDGDCIPADDSGSDPISGVQDPCRRNVEASVKADTSDVAPRVLGGWLGVLMRKFQETMYQVGSAAHSYVVSCATTEDFLLGRCDGGVQNDPSGSDGNSSQCLDVWVDNDTARQYASELRQNLPGQREPSPTFAGWRRYFGIKTHPEFQHIYETCGGMRCYEYVLNRVLNESNINPYLAIGIAFNETGGLYSAQPDKSGPHFGCAPWRDESIEDKVSCFIDTLNNYQDRDKLDDDGALLKYGYVKGERNKNLNKIISILSKFTYRGTCDDNSSDSTTEGNTNSSEEVTN